METPVLSRLIEQTRANPPMEGRYNARQISDGTWVAFVQCGRRDGAFPRWGGQGQTEAEALEKAARFAMDHWFGNGVYSMIR